MSLKRQRPVASADPPLTFSLMTYNLWKTNGAPTAFDIRRPVLLRQIRRLDPDVMFAQELHPLLTDCVLDALPGHTHVQRGEEEAAGWVSEGNIFWRTQLFREVEHGAVDIGQKESERRLFWVRLAPMAAADDAVTFVFATAHYTWQGAAVECETDINVRKAQARSTVSALESIRRHTAEVTFFGGDLNEAFWPRRILSNARYKDCFAALGLPAVPTHPTRPSVMHEEQNANTALDWLFCRGDARVLLASTISDMCGLSSDDPDEKHTLAVQPSDHMPVLAVYRI